MLPEIAAMVSLLWLIQLWLGEMATFMLQKSHLVFWAGMKKKKALPRKHE